MPKTTFFKLTEQKQDSLIAAAMQEFAKATFEEVKIASIIKSAGIPRSSFYDYFEDKEDVYLYLLSMIKEQKQLYMAPLLDKESSPFFDSLREFIKAGALFAAHYPLYEKIAKSFYANTQLMQTLLGEDRPNMISLYEELLLEGIASGELAPDLDAPYMAECIYQLTTGLTAGYDKETDQDISEMIAEKSEKLISLLEKGIAYS
ncbi:TetR/AcrR family transcriptional regulator [Planococcus maritimus]|uniref:TetR/AcrR family transcriptional regulator n=1 Tax=Planococcus maritimus TaxID=192421 RepID=UPI003139CB1A